MPQARHHAARLHQGPLEQWHLCESIACSSTLAPPVTPRRALPVQRPPRASGERSATRAGHGGDPPRFSSRAGLLHFADCRERAKRGQEARLLPNPNWRRRARTVRGRGGGRRRGRRASEAAAGSRLLLEAESLLDHPRPNAARRAAARGRAAPPLTPTRAALAGLVGRRHHLPRPSHGGRPAPRPSPARCFVASARSTRRTRRTTAASAEHLSRDAPSGRALREGR